MPKQTEDHATAAMEHLTWASEATGDTASVNYHLSAASIRATLASAEAARWQADALREMAQVNTRLLDFMAQQPAAVETAPEADHA